MEYKYVLYEPGRVARIKFNRPEYRNALSYVMIEEANDAFSRAEADDEVQVMVLSGEGRDFSGGHDLGSPESLAENEERGFRKNEMNRYLAEKEHKLDMKLHLRGLTKPTIAMVHGWCIYGGFMYASACDIIFASEDAKFLPGGANQYYPLPYDIGVRKAKEILFEIRAITPQEARDFGLVNRVYPRDRLEEETLAFANRVADNFRVRSCKMVLNHIQDAMGFSAEMDYAFHVNHIRRELAYDSPEARVAGIRGVGRRERRVAQADVALMNLKLKQEAEV